MSIVGAYYKDRDDYTLGYKFRFRSQLVEKGCAMVKVKEKELLQKLKDFAAAIPDDELADDGREDEFHITILYGFTVESPDIADVIEHTMNQWCSEDNGGKLPVATLGKVDHFECDNFDVVKVSVESEDLAELNDLFRRTFPYENDHPEYKPHVTLAYVKKGEGKKYDGDDTFEGREIKCDSIIFSDTDNKKTDFVLSQ